jgi:hypothetical protein
VDVPRKQMRRCASLISIVDRIDIMPRDINHVLKTVAERGWLKSVPLFSKTETRPLTKIRNQDLKSVPNEDIYSVFVNFNASSNINIKVARASATQQIDVKSSL